MIRAVISAALVSALAVKGQATPSAGHLLIISGSSGEPVFAKRFESGARALREVALTRYAVAQENIYWLAEDSTRAGVSGRSTKERLQQTIERIVAASRAGDDVWIVYFGHGSNLNGGPRLNLPGPDLAPQDLAAMLDRLSGRSVGVVLASSGTGDFLPVLAGKGRVIVSATKTAREQNESLFGEHFVRGLTTDGADADKNERISLLEAYLFAVREVARVYEQTNRLQTEHAVISDDGKAAVAGAPTGGVGQQFLAGRVYLGPGATAVAASRDPKTAGLIAELRATQTRLDSLRNGKSSMSENAYEAALEPLLLKIATLSKQLRDLGVKP